MKKYLLLMLVVLTGIISSCKYDDDELWGSVEDAADRIAALETLTKQKNSDIAAMQAILSALENQVAVSEVENLTDGYILHFTDGTSATIKNGTDGKDGAGGEEGKDGANGEDGKDGSDGEDGKDGSDGEDGKDGKDAPYIYIKKDMGVYYWTITVNGRTTWLTDDYGRKLPVVPTSGLSGIPGMNGTDGKDGVAPMVSVDQEGYWTVSTNGGRTYSRIIDEGTQQPVKAVGDKGGPGDKGDSLFNGVIPGDGVVTIKDANGFEYTLPILKAITFYADIAKTPLDNTKTIEVSGEYKANVWFGLTLENARYEVVADDQIANVQVSLPNSTNELGSVSVTVKEGITVQEARVVILFFSGNKTITAVLKFGSVAAWDGVSVTAASEVQGEPGVYAIGTPANLAWVAQVVNDGTDSFEGKTIRLMNNINLGGHRWTSIGTVEHPFKGTLDGNGKTISNMNVGTALVRALRSRAETTTAGTGLFGVTENAKISDVTISNATVNGEENSAAGVLVGVATGTTEVSGVKIENASATASGSESAAGLVVGKATGSITVSGVEVTSTPVSGEEETNNNKVEATYAGGVVGHVAADNVKVEGTTVSGLDLGVNANEGTEAAGGAVLGKVEAASVTVTDAAVEGVKVTVSGDTTSDNASNVSVGAVAGAVADAANADIKIDNSSISDVKVETENEETAENINQGTVLGNLNEVIDSNPEAAAGILNGNQVSANVEIKNKMKVESLNAMFVALTWDAYIVPQYSFDIDGEIAENTTLVIPQQGYTGKLNLNFKSLASSESAIFTIQQNEGYNAGMEVNLNFNAANEGQYVIANMPSSAVNLLSGHFATFEVWTTNLYIADGVTIDNLIVHGGNIRVAAEGKITGSITNQGSELVYVVLEEGATAENNLPTEENIGENIEITSTNNTVTIENTELAIALQGILGTDKVTIDENGYAVMIQADVNTITRLDFNWRGYTITSLEGIENFKNLEELYLNSVGLLECDLSQNQALRYLDLKWNIDLVSLDFSNNPNLETLLVDYCRNLTTLNLEGCEKLSNLQVRRTALSELVVPNPAGIKILSLAEVPFAFDLTEYTGLTALNISNLNLTSLDIIPDTIKENLVEVSCTNNQLSSIDLAQYSNLVTLDCSNNQIQTLDLSAAPGLVNLYCYRNLLGTLDISALAGLKNLSVGNQRQNIMMILTLTEDQKIMWNDNWKNSGNNKNIRLYDEIINNPETGTGGSGFGNGGKF